MRQIIAMGGGGFLMEPENPLLDQYILDQAGKTRPRVCYVGTASGDTQINTDRFYEAFGKLDCVPSHLSLFKPPLGSLEDYVLAHDVIYVGGGNTRNLMVLWREWGVDGIFRKAWEKGIVMSGISAGSLCWFEEGVTDSITGTLTPIRCLGFLKGSNCPHYDGEAERRPAYQKMMLAGQLSPGLAADDGVALHYKGESLFKVISSRPAAKAFRVSAKGGAIEETAIRPEYLGR